MQTIPMTRPSATGANPDRPDHRRRDSGALENIAIEMGHKLMRMSYSSIIRELEDFGAALDRRRRPAIVRVQDEHAATVRADTGLYPRYSQNVLRRAVKCFVRAT